jgi:hypothetical protein
MLYEKIGEKQYFVQLKIALSVANPNSQCNFWTIGVSVQKMTMQLSRKSSLNIGASTEH